MELSATTSHYQPTDDLTLMSQQDHPLWQTRSFLHCSSQAAWAEYKTVIGQIPQQYWYRDFTATVRLWFGGEQWSAFKDSVDRVYCYLRDCQFPTNHAVIRHLVLQVRDENSDSPLLRAKSALCVYVRIDHDHEQRCSLAFGTGESVDIAPGTMVVASGFRRHKLCGVGHFVHYQLDLPAQARVETLQGETFHQDALSDELVFAASTALPLSQPLADVQTVANKLAWLQSLVDKRQRNKDHPMVQRFLLDNVSPALATEDELEQVRQFGMSIDDPNVDNITLVENVPLLSAGQCLILRQFIDDHITSTVPDTVDGLPEYQIDVPVLLLNQILDPDTTQKLLNLPTLLDDNYSADGPQLPEIGIFLRIYSPQTRPYIAFHHDICRYTCVVALNDKREFAGGHFVMLANDRLQCASWQEGTALLHAGNLIHGVSRLTEGTRYSLVMFINTPSHTA
jgi:hypothetical protein